jgi:hypothetical protein
MRDRRVGQIRLSTEILNRLVTIRDKVNQLHNNGQLWSSLDVEEIDMLKEINTTLVKMIEKRKGTF